jgi:hypothetical protein
MNKSCEKTTTAHSQNIVHVDVLYNIKRKKYKRVCAELVFAKSSSTECNFFSLLAVQLDYCNIQRVLDQK